MARAAALASGHAYLQEEFGKAPPATGLFSALSQLWRFGDYRRYVDSRSRLPAILGLTYYAGDLRLSGPNQAQSGEGDVMLLWARPTNIPEDRAFKTVMREHFTYIPHKDCQKHAAKMAIIQDGVELWAGETKPDHVLAPPGAQGKWTELVTEETACARRLEQRSSAGSARLLRWLCPKVV